MNGKSTNSPVVSIGVMTFNRAYYLSGLIDCLLAQTFKDFELILFDDVSSDDTQKICEEYARKDSRIKYIRPERNVNIPGCFDAVLRPARGKYFMWVQDDDRYHERFVEDCVRVFEKNSELVMVFADMVDIDRDEKIINHPDPRKYMPLAKNEYDRLKEFMLFYFGEGRNQLICGLWRREALLFHPRFGPRPQDDQYPYHWGFENYFIFQMLSKGPVGFFPETRFYRRSRRHEAEHIPRNPVSRFAITFYHRAERIFKTPYFWHITINIVRLGELSPWQKCKLTFWNFYGAARLFFSRKI